jgi:hypothetical protein
MAPQPELLEKQGVSLCTRQFRHSAEVVRCRANRHLFFQHVLRSADIFSCPCQTGQEDDGLWSSVTGCFSTACGAHGWSFQYPFGLE